MNPLLGHNVTAEVLVEALSGEPSDADLVKELRGELQVAWKENEEAKATRHYSDTSFEHFCEIHLGVTLGLHQPHLVPILVQDAPPDQFGC